jgi:hypothetical protein
MKHLLLSVQDTERLWNVFGEVDVIIGVARGASLKCEVAGNS